MENSTVAANEAPAVAASAGGASDREAQVFDHSEKEDFIDDSDMDPTFCVPDEQIYLAIFFFLELFAKFHITIFKLQQLK